MRRRDSKIYYALVWSDVLNEQIKLKGEKINQNVELPDDPRILYGTNENDVFKVIKDVIHESVSYDVMTTKQSVEFYVEQVEYIMPRDVRILVWEGESELLLPCEDYRVVSPQMFESLVG